MKSSKTIVEEYLKKSDWRVKENSNSPYSFGALNKYITAEVSKDYWLREVYPEQIAQAYVDGHIHIHDLGGLSLYCCGYSLKDILLKGVRGVPNIPVSAPAKHFDSVLNQIANLTTVFQNEIMGAVAFNGFDTLLAPFIKQDNLSYIEVKQNLQNYIFSINSNSRAGAEPAFSNVTFDLTPPEDMLDEYAIIGGELVSFTYGSCQHEMDMLNRAFYEIMLSGDADGKLFAYPIPTYNIHKRFDWENPNNKMLWELAGKYGTPYFANFINSDLDIKDVRSMCCRLRLDLSELRHRNGGLFGAGDSTGSIGVVTINLPRLGYECKGNYEKFYAELDRYLDIAKDSLEIKRDWLQKNVIETNLIPAYMEYVGTLNNHFSTIGIIGMNEMCENFMGKNILDDEAHKFCHEVGEHIRQRLLAYQDETGHLYNYEATPAESTCYRFALIDKKYYPDIISQGSGKDCYYTNSCHIPVKLVRGIDSTFSHQNDLQKQFTGGTVIHVLEEGAITGEQAKAIVKAMLTTYEVPYMSLSPISRYCDTHGYIVDRVDKCPICKSRLKKYQRITGYLRCVDNYNRGKAAEFNDRMQLDPTGEFLPS
jgi:ribonucleoside-triphosphate reductase (formate)